MYFGKSEINNPEKNRGFLPDTNNHGFRILFWFFLGCVCAVPKLLMIILADAEVIGDSYVYLNVAENIFLNTCVSMSEPTVGLCHPHWGGNQLPGYPAFIAATWFIFGKSVTPVLLVQTAVYVLTVTILCRALSRYDYSQFKSRLFLVIVAFLLGASPSLVGWSRVIFTETLSVALGIWLLALLVSSLAEQRLRVLGIGLVTAAGLFVRYDFAFMAIPIAIVGFYLHPPWVAMKRLLIVICIVILPLGGWTARCVTQGLELTPPFGLTTEGKPLPSGMLRWVGTWLDNQYQLETSIWALVNYDYVAFAPPEEAFATASEKMQILLLLQKLRYKSQGQMAPSEIDAEFDRLTREKIEAASFKQRMGLRIRRLGNMWLSPFPSMGWPAQSSGLHRYQIKQAFHARDWTQIFDTALDIPWIVATKLLVAGHRYYLLLITFLMTVYCCKNKELPRFLLLLIIGFSIVRSMAFSFTPLTETRYLTPVLAWLDVIAVVAIFFFISNKRIKKI